MRELREGEEEARREEDVKFQLWRLFHYSDNPCICAGLPFNGYLQIRARDGQHGFRTIRHGHQAKLNAIWLAHKLPGHVGEERMMPKHERTKVNIVKKVVLTVLNKKKKS